MQRWTVLNCSCWFFQSCGCVNFRELDIWLSHNVISQANFPLLSSHATFPYCPFTVTARPSLDITKPKVQGRHVWWWWSCPYCLSYLWIFPHHLEIHQSLWIIFKFLDFLFLPVPFYLFSPSLSPCFLWYIHLYILLDMLQMITFEHGCHGLEADTHHL